MELIGDIERLVATNVYPNRYLLATFGMAVAIGLVMLARRWGWFGLARRHPVGTSTIALAVVVVLAPVTWYLASPLVISTSIVEAAPPRAAAAAAPSPAEVGGGGSAPAPSRPAPAVLADPTAASLPVERRGSFAGADEFHFSSGSARLIPDDGGGWTLRLEDFAVRNGPDLFIYLSPKAKRYAKDALEVGRLKADRGAFNYRLPAGLDPSAYRSVVVWCKQFGVQFAHATLDDEDHPLHRGRRDPLARPCALLRLSPRARTIAT